MTLSPIIYDNLVDLFESLTTISDHHYKTSDENALISHFLPLTTDLSIENFYTNYYRKNPVLFETSAKRMAAYAAILQLLDLEYVKVPLRISKLSALKRENFLPQCEEVSSAVKEGSSPWKLWRRGKDDRFGQRKGEDVPSISLKDLRADSLAVERLLPLSKDKWEENYFVSDCQAIHKMKKIVEILRKDPISLRTEPSSSSSSSSSTPIAPSNTTVPLLESVDWERIRLTVGRGNVSRLSGSIFHAHRHSASLLLKGRKHWVIFPSDDLSPLRFNPFENLDQWLHSVYPNLFSPSPSTSSSTSAGNGNGAKRSGHAMPFEVLQQEGQVLYVPEGWYHAARTVGLESISVHLQTVEEEPTDYFYYLIDGERKWSKEDYNGAVMAFRLGTSPVCVPQCIAVIVSLCEKDCRSREIFLFSIDWRPC